MKTNRKLQIAYNIASAYDDIPESGDSLGDMKSFYNHYIENHIGIDLEDNIIYDEFEQVVLEYGGYNQYDIDALIRQEYFNS